jgi:uncharacterized repeat protein (TIGR03803 family)
MIIARLRPILPLVMLGFAANIASAQLYEADSGSGRILEFTPAGVESTFASELDKPVGLAFDPSGNLYVSAAGSGKILKFTSGGVKSTFASGLNNPWGLAFDASGNLFVSASGSGKILKFASDGAESTFASGLSQPLGLAFDAFGNLFAGTSTGAAGGGEILKFTPSGAQSTFAELFIPSSLAFGPNGSLYVADNGVWRILEFTPAGVQSTFASGSNSFGLAFDPFGDLFSSNDGNWIQKIGPAGAVSTFATGLSHSGLLAFAPFSTLHSFAGGEDGGFPMAGLTQASNGDLYGTTDGTVFKITPAGTLTTLYSFCAQSGCTDGKQPGAALVQAANGDLYGTTAGGGGASSGGTVFKITPSGALTTLYSFCSQNACADGGFPVAGMVQATNGDLYGTTEGGGANGGGTVFKITPRGTLTTLYSFCSQGGCADGEFPYAGLIQAANGDLYGTTASGGTNRNCGSPAQPGPGCGVIFKITPSGAFTTLYSFCSQSDCTDGATPYGALVQATNGDFYGTTAWSGPANSFSGTVFKITPNGTLTTLYSFCAQTGCPDGLRPTTGLIQASDGDLYGTTGDTVFKITPAGSLTTLYSICPDGCPFTNGGLVQATTGKFYGTTSESGADNDGTIFSLSLGLNAFVKTQTASGNIGATVKIIGTRLSTATSVTFNGVAAAFTVDSSSEISATVPAGATTGKVQVTLPAGTLSSNVAFQVP